MDYGTLSSYFSGAVGKTPSGVDIGSNRSHQHEFNGTGALRGLFGDDDLKNMSARFAYLRDETFPAVLLTMLAAKTTAKERWRQVLREADRIGEKHLITLEPAISEDYTASMRRVRLQLVVPRPLFNTYTTTQQAWLMDVEGFCDLVEERQRKADGLR